MYAKRIIPCLDVKNGRVVKGMSFVNLVDAGDPVESAMQYDKQGADAGRSESILRRWRGCYAVVV